MSTGWDRQTDGDAEEVAAGRRCCAGPPPGCMAGALHSQSDTCNATTMHPREGRGHLPPGLGAGGRLVPPQPSSPCRWCPWGGCPAPGSPAGSCWPSHSGPGWPGSHPVCSARHGQLGKSAGQHGEGASCKVEGARSVPPSTHTRCSKCVQQVCASPSGRGDMQ